VFIKNDIIGIIIRVTKLPFTQHKVNTSHITMPNTTSAIVKNVGLKVKYKSNKNKAITKNKLIIIDFGLLNFTSKKK
jgi:hypothetical protein